MKFSNVPLFIIELAKRFFTKTPAFFSVLKYLGLTAALITKLPDFLESAGINVPVVVDPYKTILVVAGFVTFLVSQLTTKADPAIANQEGQIIIPSTCGTDLPYSEKKEVEHTMQPVTDPMDALRNQDPQTTLPNNLK